MAIHIMVGASGGGKTLMANVLTQYLQAQGQSVLCLDMDGFNRPLLRFAELQAEAVDASELPRLLAELDSGEHVVIDQGPGPVVRLPEAVTGMGQDLTIHVAVTANDAERQLRHLAGMLEGVPDAECVLWVNPIHGSLEDLARLDAYDALRGRVHGLLQMRSPVGLFGRALNDMLKRGMTFRQALGDARIDLLSRQRLAQLRRQFYQGIEATRAVAVSCA